MKGKAPSAKQKKFHDLLAQNIGCQACYQDNGSRNTHVSIHHIDGRTKPMAHWEVLAVCAGHHQDGYGPFPMLAIHGAKTRFEKEYGTQMQLLSKAVHDLVDQGFDVPPEAMGYAL